MMGFSFSRVARLWGKFRELPGNNTFSIDRFIFKGKAETQIHAFPETLAATRIDNSISGNRYIGAMRRRWLVLPIRIGFLQFSNRMSNRLTNHRRTRFRKT